MSAVSLVWITRWEISRVTDKWRWPTGSIRTDISVPAGKDICIQIYKARQNQNKSIKTGR